MGIVFKRESVAVSLSNFYFDTVVTITIYDDDKSVESLQSFPGYEGIFVYETGKIIP